MGTRKLCFDGFLGESDEMSNFCFGMSGEDIRKLTSK